MNDAKPSLPLWPFIVVDALFLGLATILLKNAHHPLMWQEGGVLVLCGCLGAWSFLTPFLRRNADEQAFSQARLLAEATSQIQKLDQLAAQISGTTNQWLELQGHTAEAAASAKNVADRMSAEAKAFTEFMQRTSETERNHLRVEVEKLRRAEGERLQVIIHVLDHVFALFQAARHSGQPALLEQIGQFHNACRDAVRRLGLVQTTAQAGEAYDAKLHQLPENVSPAENALVADTLVAGYTYQGQPLRRPVVAVNTTSDNAPTTKE
jgi:molecular chaperone GrpE (heat shock protein)